MEKSWEDTLLHAIRIEDYDTVSYALSKGANPNKTVGHGKTCLGEAANVGNIDILKLLISAIISNKGPNKSPTHSNEKRYVKGYKRKLKHDDQNEELNVKCKSFNDGNRINNQGYFEFIHGECSDENRRTGLKSPLSPVSVLTSPQAELEWDEDIGNVAPTTREDETWTSMYKWYAAILENSGAAIASASNLTNSIDQQDVFARSALHYAAEKGHVDVIKLLIESGCKIDIEGSDGLTPLHVATIKNKIEAVKFLLAAGSNVGYKTHKKMTALHFAASRGYLDLVKLIVTYDDFLEARDSNEKTALYFAAGGGHLDVVKYLISCGAYVNCEEVHGYTPLCEAVWQKCSNVVELLLKSGARITHSHRLLHNAVTHRQGKIIEMLTNVGGGINLRNDKGDTPLLLATRLGLPDMAKVLLSQGANVNLCNSITGSSAVHIAVENVNDPDVFEELIVCLLEYNVNIDATALCGDTALNRALFLQKDHAAALLVRHGANVHLYGERSGIDNLRAATQRSYTSLATLILKAGHQPILKQTCYYRDISTYRCLRNLCSNPLTLSDICRIKIRNLRRNGPMFSYISSLPLPKSMVKFLMLRDEGIL